MNEKLKWVLSILALPGILLFMLIINQWGYNKNGYISFKGSYFIGEEALFILAILKIFLSIISIQTIAVIYKRCADKEIDEKFLINQQKNETYVCLDCKEAFLTEGKEICKYCGSHDIEPVKGIYKKYPNFESSLNQSGKPEKFTYLKAKSISKEERIFKLFLIAWSVLWAGVITYKSLVDKDFIAIIIFAWPFLAIAYLVPFIIKIIRY